jgi:hypothetical protein
VNGLLWLWLACLLLSACCCWRHYLCRSQESVHEPLLQAFPFPSTLGEVTAPVFSGLCFIYSSHGKWVFPPLLWCFPPTAIFTSFPAPDCWVVLLLLPAGVFVYSSHGKWVFPPLLWSFPPSATLTSFPTPGCWACNPLLLEPLRQGPACLFTVPGRIPLTPLRSSGLPTLFAMCLSCSYCLLLSLFFSLMGVSLSRGLC